MASSGEPQQHPGLNPDIILALADGSLLEKLQGVGAEVVTALQDALEVAQAIQAGNRDQIAAVLSEIATAEEPTTPTPELMALREIFGSADMPKRLSALALSTFRPESEGVAAFIEANQADVDTLPARRQHRETAHGIAQSVMKIIEDGKIFALKNRDMLRLEAEGRVPQDGLPFIYRFHERDQRQDYCHESYRSPFVPLASGEQLAIGHMWINSGGVDGPAEQRYRLVTKVEADEDTERVPDSHLNGIPYAQIPADEDRTIWYPDTSGRPRKLDSRIAETADREVVEKLQMVSDKLLELHAQTAAIKAEAEEAKNG